MFGLLFYCIMLFGSIVFMWGFHVSMWGHTVCMITGAVRCMWEVREGVRAPCQGNLVRLHVRIPCLHVRMHVIHVMVSMWGQWGAIICMFSWRCMWMPVQPCVDPSCVELLWAHVRVHVVRNLCELSSNVKDVELKGF